MPNQTFEPGLWSLILAAFTGAAGWIWRGGSERAKTEAALQGLLRDHERMDKRINALENGSVAITAAQASIAAQLEGIGRTLTRLESKLDSKADR
ncbi:MAG: hypothetical protein M0R28_20440 [Pigmentiphaga sp.]|nr:hypothetical protein [Pigmentiphaga sp.]